RAVRHHALGRCGAHAAFRPCGVRQRIGPIAEGGARVRERLDGGETGGAVAIPRAAACGTATGGAAYLHGGLVAGKARAPIAAPAPEGGLEEFLMRILLAQNSLYYPSHGGGDKSNRLLMEALAARGHQTRVVSRVESFGKADGDKLRDDLAARGVEHSVIDGGLVTFKRNGVDVFTV